MPAFGGSWDYAREYRVIVRVSSTVCELVLLVSAENTNVIVFLLDDDVIIMRSELDGALVEISRLAYVSYGRTVGNGLEISASVEGLGLRTVGYILVVSLLKGCRGDEDSVILAHVSSADSDRIGKILSCRELYRALENCISRHCILSDRCHAHRNHDRISKIRVDELIDFDRRSQFLDCYV